MPKKDNFEGDPRIEPLAAIVAAGATITEAADQLGLSESVGYKLSATPAFRKSKLSRLVERADAIAETAIASERAALDALNRLLNSDDDTVVVSAAKGILSHASRASTILEKQLDRANAEDREAKYQPLFDILDCLAGNQQTSK